MLVQITTVAGGPGAPGQVSSLSIEAEKVREIQPVTNLTRSIHSLPPEAQTRIMVEDRSQALVSPWCIQEVTRRVNDALGSPGALLTAVEDIVRALERIDLTLQERNMQI